MKRIFAAALCALSTFAFGATLAPIQLLNPAGSTSGQVITSNGPTAAPSWQSVTYGILPTIAANSVLGNKTTSAATPSAVALPSCSTANSALQYTSGTGFSCGSAFALTSGTLAQFAATTSAQLAGVVSDETGSGALVFGTSPSISNPTLTGTTTAAAITASGLITPASSVGIKGSTTNDSPAAGSIGENPSAGPTTTGNLTTGVAANITSLSLTTGDWVITGACAWSPSGGASLTVQQCGISTTSATFGGFGTTTSLMISGGSASGSGIPTPTVDLKLAAPTTVYLVTNAGFGSGTVTATGLIRARRPR
ncbi:hypothetical protein I5589_06815 [Burkholderia vietnamiensis]|uniref:Uncharacterized protein n=1 Tax=Burkholderia vietnamiensis TaxID=60552 RepID=A0ABS1ARL5_BURVI|nr:hypothetical protein [Burkholderia vietnamiensis]MBJ9686789.1 hypothetical protein [Burkholderia vietnamiensis]